MDLHGYSIKFKIQPGFGAIEDHLLRINSSFAEVQSIIQNRRNDIRVDNINDFRVVIKSFKGMYWPNRLAYSFFRKSKAQRSFETSVRLLSLGLQVPAPVAYIDYYKWGILKSSYFISLYQEHEDLQTALSKYSNSHNLPKAFGAFVYQLHKKGVLHQDLSNGNILCVAQNGGINFSMVDLNRVRFQAISYDAGLKNLSRLGLDPSIFNEILKAYTGLWRKSLEHAITSIEERKNSRRKAGKVKLFLKSVFFPSRMSAVKNQSKFDRV